MTTITTSSSTSTTPAKPPVLIYTDGACYGNPGPGGWGVYMNNGRDTRELCGSEPAETTNQRMELMAAIKALKFFTSRRRLTIRSDSQYLINGMTRWMAGWIAKGWRNGHGKPVSNQDLWVALKALADQHDVTWQWVKGHSGEPGNERADALASAACAVAVAQATSRRVDIHV